MPQHKEQDKTPKKKQGKTPEKEQEETPDPEKKLGNLQQFTSKNSVTILVVGPPAGDRPVSMDMVENYEHLLHAWLKTEPALLNKNTPTCHGVVKYQWKDEKKRAVGEYLFRRINHAWNDSRNRREILMGTDKNKKFTDRAYRVSIDEFDELTF